MLPDPDDMRRLLAEIAAARMPFGRYGREKFPPNGCPLMDLPIEYLVWFAERGFPKGRLGELMKEVYALKANGMDALLDPFRQANGGPTKWTKPRTQSWKWNENQP